MKQKEINKLDKEWKLAVRKRDECCQICGKSDCRLNAHHLIPKQFREYRWKLDNGMLLCTHHHTLGKWSPHKNAVWFTEWLIENKPDIYLQIKKELNNKNESKM